MARRITPYMWRVEQGLCGQGCGRAKIEGKNSCQECIDRAKQKRAERAAEKIAQGLCLHCGNRPLESGKTRCRECLDKINQLRKTREEQKVAQGLCIWPSCQNKTEPGYKMCKECRIRRASSRRSILNQGLCAYSCGRPRLEDKTLCQECRDKKKQRRKSLEAEKIAQGLCVRLSCQNKPEPGYKMCSSCIEKSYIIVE